VKKAIRVKSRDGRMVGVPTGAERRCQLSGCTGRRLGVRWPDGKITYPCTKGMIGSKFGWQIA